MLRCLQFSVYSGPRTRDPFLAPVTLHSSTSPAIGSKIEVLPLAPVYRLPA